MYKLLLSWRYLRTRFIALASIVSVTLGVATLIVVNSVMSGFIVEMKERLHGILSDVEIAAPGLGEIPYPDTHIEAVRSVVGDQLASITKVVRVPALMNFEFRGRQWTQQVMLIGIDEETFGQVTDFMPFLTNRHKQQHLSFQLEESGYPDRLGNAGWEYRRIRAENRKQLDRILTAPQKFSTTGAESSDLTRIQQTFQPLPRDDREFKAENREVTFPPEPWKLRPFDQRAHLRSGPSPEEMFDPAKNQYTGIILGLAISNRKFVNPETEQHDEIFMIRPGDDIQITLPTAGSAPQAITENCTLVDFYASNMHEYDSNFAFVPLRKLQQVRRMIDPATGMASVSSIQIKLRPGSDLSAVRDKLNARFPPDQYGYVIQTWQDTQGPLLSAVNLEVAILNILLFLIIAVAGFGILATFYMIVVEKTKDIGILKALGAPSSGIMSIFLSYGLVLGMVGTGVGIVLGYVFVIHINSIADAVQYLTGHEVFDPTIYYFDKIPTIINPATVFLVACGAIGIAVLASVMPALRAARLHPVEALRYE